jgi:trimeric autotransporter adhesin
MTMPSGPIFPVLASAPFLRGLLAAALSLGASAATGAQSLDVKLEIVSTSKVLSDPLNGTHQPRVIPGSVVEFVVSVQNVSSASPGRNSVKVGSAVPQGVTLFVGTGQEAPVTFVDGVTSSALAYRYNGLADLGDSVEFSCDGGASYSCIPHPDAAGFDPRVTHFRVAPLGIMAPATAAPTTFEIHYKVKVN